MKYWTPREKPPHPSDIQGISSFGQSIISNLRKRSSENEEKLRKLRPKPYQDWREQEYRTYQTWHQYSQLEFYGLEGNTGPSRFDSVPYTENTPNVAVTPRNIVHRYTENRPVQNSTQGGLGETLMDTAPPPVLVFQKSGPPLQEAKTTDYIEDVDLFDVGVESQLLRALEDLEGNVTTTQTENVSCEAPDPYEKEKIMDLCQHKSPVEVSFPSPEKAGSEPVIGHYGREKTGPCPLVVENEKEVSSTSRNQTTFGQDETPTQASSQPVKKRKKFEAPFNKKLVQTKLPFENKEKEKIQVIELNKSSIADMASQIVYGEPLEICLMLECTEARGDIGVYKEVLLRIQWQEDNVEYCSISRHLFKTEKEKVGHFFRTVLSSKTSIVCLEAAELMVYLIHKFRYEPEVTVLWNVADPLVAWWLLDADHPCITLDALAKNLNLGRLEPLKYSDAATKACKYLDLLSKSYRVLKERLTNENLWRIFVDLEVRITPILARMTQRGVEVEVEQLSAMGTCLGRRLAQLEAEARSLAGHSFLITSPQQLRTVLFQELKLDQKINFPVKGTATLGLKSTSESVLRQLSQHHRLPEIVLDHRKLHKIKTTFVDGLVTFIKKGRVHTVWEQRSAATGRLASSNPNLQAIPKQWFTVDLGAGAPEQMNIRSVFKPRPGYVFLLADFRQMELRVFAHLAQDKDLIRILNQSDDVFTTLAELWLKDEKKKVTGKVLYQETSRNDEDKEAEKKAEGCEVGEKTLKRTEEDQEKTERVEDGEKANRLEDREKTKRMVYAVLYGAGPGKVAQVLDKTLKDATALYNKFNAAFPIMRSFGRRVTESCAKDGRVSTPMGRIRKFAKMGELQGKQRAQAERQAFNFLIQGTAADMCKRAMLLTEEALCRAEPRPDAHLLLQIHDELVWEVSQDCLNSVTEMIRGVMENGRDLTGSTCDLPIAIQVAIQHQNSWASDSTKQPSSSIEDSE